jgi:hypothetical protein
MSYAGCLSLCGGTDISAGSQLLVDGVLARSLYMYRWAWRPGTVWVRDLADHAPINYVSAVEYSKV